MIVYASFPFELPADLKFDGMQEVGPTHFFQFTEHDEASPSMGATFYVEAAKCLEAEIAARRAEVCEIFAASRLTGSAGVSPAVHVAPNDEVGAS